MNDKKLLFGIQMIYIQENKYNTLEIFFTENFGLKSGMFYMQQKSYKSLKTNAGCKSTKT
jgi:hypothetical protein